MFKQWVDLDIPKHIHLIQKMSYGPTDYLQKFFNDVHKLTLHNGLTTGWTKLAATFRSSISYVQPMATNYYLESTFWRNVTGGSPRVVLVLC